MYPFRSEAIFDTVIPLKMMTNAFYLNLRLISKFIFSQPG